MNTKRLNAAFENDKFLEDLRVVFPTTFDTIRTEKKLQGSVEERHYFIIQQLHKEFERVLGSRVYYTAFEFREEDQNTPSHYLLHITKGPKGYELIKQICSQYDNVPRVLEGVATYTFDPKYFKDDNMMDEMFRQENIDKLKSKLETDFKCETIDAESLFNKHQKDTKYAKPHYRLALRQLANEGKISVKYTDGKNHQVSVLLIRECIITFK